MLVSPQVRGLKEGRTEVKIKMRHLVTDHIWLFSRNQFLDKKDHMQAMYHSYMEGEKWDLPKVSQSHDQSCAMPIKSRLCWKVSVI